MASGEMGPKLSGAGYDLGPDRHTGVADESVADLIEISGTIKWFDVSKGFGFITPDDGSKDVFVHITDVQRAGLDGLREGDKLSYELQQGQQGKVSATNLRLT